MKRVQLLLVACFVFSVGQSAHAQYGRRFSAPTLSPWLTNSRNQSHLGSYLGNVRPEQQLRRTLSQHGASLRRQRAGLSTLGRQMIDFEQTGSMRPTGTGAGFMNYSHFYQFPGMSAGRRSMSRPTSRPTSGRPSMPTGARHR